MNSIPLRGRKVVERVRRRGAVWRGKHMKVFMLPGADLAVGTSVSLKTEKSAVKRNRMRRRCREALRLTLQNIHDVPAYQLILTPRSSSLTCDFAELRRDAEALFSHLHHAT